MLSDGEVEAMAEESFDGWKAVQDLEMMSIQDFYHAGFLHGIEEAKRIFQEFTGTPLRDKLVDDELKHLFTLIDNERFDEARAAIAQLKNKLGDDEPELTRASALIRFLEDSE